MSYWAFNERRAEISTAPNSAKGYMTIFQKRNVSIEVGDKFVTVGRSKKSDNISSEGDHFIQYGKVTQKVINDGESKNARNFLLPGNDFNKIVLSLEFNGEIEHDLAVKDYAYTISVVKDFWKVNSYFSKEYRRISNRDFDLIVEGEINLGRTIFGSLVNALPKEHRIQFMHIISRRTEDFLDYLNGRNYEKAIKLLENYIKDYILSQGRFIYASYKLLEENFPEMPISEISFADDSSLLAENYIGNRQRIEKLGLKDQAIQFLNLFNLEKEYEIWDEINRALEQIKQEDRKRENNKLSWPIKLK